MGLQYNEIQANIAKTLEGVTLGHGLSGGTDAKEAHTCTIGAIHMAMTGKVADTLLPCMSNAVRMWAISTQDAIPAHLLSRDDPHGRQWRRAVPLIAGSAEVDPLKQAEIMIEWMWHSLGGTTAPDWVPVAAQASWERELRKRGDFNGIGLMGLWGFYDTHASVGLSNFQAHMNWLHSATIRDMDVETYGIEVACRTAAAVWSIASKIWWTTRGTESDALEKFWVNSDPASALLDMCTV